MCGTNKHTEKIKVEKREAECWGWGTGRGGELIFQMHDPSRLQQGKFALSRGGVGESHAHICGGRMSQAEGAASAQPPKEKQSEASLAAVGINEERAKMWSEGLQMCCEGQ